MKRWTAVLLAILVLGAPVWAMKVNIFSRPGIDFSQFKTYALTVPVPDERKDPDGSAKKIREQVKKSAAETLKSQGLVETEPDKADLHLTYAGSVYAGLYGARWQGTGQFYGWSFGSVESYAAGTVVLELLDPKTKDVMWRGSANPGFGEMMDQNKILKQVDKSVKKILKSYPPKK